MCFLHRSTDKENNRHCLRSAPLPGTVLSTATGSVRPPKQPCEEWRPRGVRWLPQAHAAVSGRACPNLCSVVLGVSLVPRLAGRFWHLPRCCPDRRLLFQIRLLLGLERAGGLLGGGRGSPGPLRRAADPELGMAPRLLWHSTDGLGECLPGPWRWPMEGGPSSGDMASYPRWH